VRVRLVGCRPHPPLHRRRARPVGVHPVHRGPHRGRGRPLAQALLHQPVHGRPEPLLDGGGGRLQLVALQDLQRALGVALRLHPLAQRHLHAGQVARDVGRAGGRPAGVQRLQVSVVRALQVARVVHAGGLQLRPVGQLEAAARQLKERALQAVRAVCGEADERGLHHLGRLQEEQPCLLRRFLHQPH